MRQREHWDDTRADLEAVINSRYLFSGTRATALVKLADVSRITGDHAQAESLLSKAVKDPEIREEVWIDAMIVGGLLLEDSRDMDGAREMWRKVLATTSANDDQQRIARRRLDALLPKESGHGD